MYEHPLQLNSYNFIYIPVETNISDYLRLENSSLQYLIGEDIKSKIDSVFDTNVELDGISKKIIDILNDNLKEYVTSVQETIQRIDNSYSFDTDFVKIVSAGYGPFILLFFNRNFLIAGIITLSSSEF